MLSCFIPAPTFMRFFIAILAYSLTCVTQADVQHYFDSIHHEPNALYAFFKAMPKGGELHYHFSGSIYPENMLALIAEKPYCLDEKTQTIQLTQQCTQTTMPALFQNPQRYNNTLRAWSMKDFIPGKETGEDHFFAVFPKIEAIMHDFRAELLADILNRAAKQHELYMEIILTNVELHDEKLDHQLARAMTFAEQHQIITHHPAFIAQVKQTLVDTHKLWQQTQHVLHCDKDPEQPVCQIKVRFQSFVRRGLPLQQVFTQAEGAFALAQDPLFAGVNLLGREDDLIALQDYKQHMHLFAQLHHYYPKTNLALHAGELAPQSVSPQDLAFHIHDAIQLGHATRIGHGTDIAYEDHPKIVRIMARRPIPVEINLISNHQVLNIRPQENPLTFYLQHHVPVVLSTDDEGILRTDLTRQYVSAVLNHALDYNTIKQINRNALTYSFLPGRSLWRHPETEERVAACKKLHSSSCKDFISHHEKAHIQWQLEQQLITFEQQFHDAH